MKSKVGRLWSPTTPVVELLEVFTHGKDVSENFGKIGS